MEPPPQLPQILRTSYESAHLINNTCTKLTNKQTIIVRNIDQISNSPAIILMTTTKELPWGDGNNYLSIQNE